MLSVLFGYSRRTNTSTNPTILKQLDPDSPDSYHKDVMRALSLFSESRWLVAQGSYKNQFSPRKDMFLRSDDSSIGVAHTGSREIHHTYQLLLCSRVLDDARMGTITAVTRFANNIHDIGNRRASRLAGDKFSLWLALSSFRTREALEDIDKVYGLLGLVDDWANANL